MAVFLFLKNTKFRKAQIILGIANIEVAYLQFQMLLFGTKEIYNYTFLINADFVVFYCFGPTIYLFVKQMIGYELKFSLKSFIHLLPPLPGLIYFIYFKTLSPNQILDYLNSSNVPLVEIAINSLGLFSFLLYFIFGLRLTIRHLRTNLNCFDKYDLARTIWLRNTTIIFIAITAITSPIVLIAQNDTFTQTLGLTGVNLVFIYLFISLFGNQELLYKSENTDDNENKYATSNIDINRVDEYARKIEELMESEKLYLTHNISIKEIAAILNLSSHHLSQVINQQFEMSFPDYINKKRINKAIELFNDPKSEKYTIEYIASDCGFCNRVSFNNAFKKFTQKTPSEFRRISL
jgi:AraC-like DNA-binding protein